MQKIGECQFLYSVGKVIVIIICERLWEKGPLGTRINFSGIAAKACHSTRLCT